MDQGIELGEGEDEQGGIHTRAAWAWTRKLWLEQGYTIIDTKKANWRISLNSQ